MPESVAAMEGDGFVGSSLLVALVLIDVAWRSRILVAAHLVPGIALLLL